MTEIRDNVAAKKPPTRAARWALQVVRPVPFLAVIGLVFWHDTTSALILGATIEVAWLAGVALERFDERRKGARHG